MATVYLDRQVAAIKRDGESLIVMSEQGRRSQLPLHLLDRLVILGRIELDSSTLGHLADAGIVISLLSGRLLREQATLAGPLHNDARRRLGQARAYDDPAWTKAWNTRLLKLKLRSQQRFLGELLEARPDKRYPLKRAIGTIVQVRQRVNHQADASANTLLGHEGAAASSYFSGLSSVFPPTFEFTGRNRRPPKDPINAMLSLGYTMLHGDAVRAIHASGLDPYLGFGHCPDWGRESLASDLIEPLRTRIDRMCWTLARKRVITLSHFSRQGQACLLSKAGRKHYYAAYEAQAKPVRRLLRRVCQTLARRFMNYQRPPGDNG